MVGLSGLCIPAIANVHILRRARPHVATVEEAPVRTVAIVPGARVYNNEVPSSVLEDRLQAALALYRKGKVRRILVSGDHREDGYDEVNAMHRYLVRHGASRDDVFLDHAGFRTFDTMQRARRVFGVTDAIVCTQEFHLARSVFLARKAGIDAVGVVADRRAYQAARANTAREFLARTRAFFDVYVIPTRAEMLGPTIPIQGSPEPTYDRRSWAFVSSVGEETK